MNVKNVLIFVDGVLEPVEVSWEKNLRPKSENFYYHTIVYDAIVV